MINIYQKIIEKVKNLNLADLIHYEEKVGGLSIDENKIILTYLNKDAEIIFQKEVSLPVGTIENGVLKNPEQLLLALKKAQENKKLPSKSVVISLPSIIAQPFIFEFFPNLKLEEINEALRLIIDSSLPLEKDKIYVDWEEIGIEKFREKKFLLAMGIKELIDPYLEVVSKSGLAPIATETHAWSLSRAVDFKGEPVLAINFEPSQIIFTVYQNNILVFQFNMPNIEAELHGTNAEQRGKELKKIGKDKKKKAKKIIEAPPIEQSSATQPVKLTGAKNDEFLEKAAILAKRLFYFLASDNFYNFKIKNVVLFGESEIKQKFQSYFVSSDLPAEVLVKAGGNELNISGVETDKSFIFSLGAAKRGLLKRRDDTICSLMPIGTESAYERQRFISFLDFFQKLAVVFGGFFIILFFGAFILISVIYQSAAKNLTKYQAEIPSGIVEIKTAAALFNQKIDQLAQIEKKSPKWENLFLELDKIINPGLIIGNLTVAVGQPVEISGVAKNRENLLQLRSVLEQSPTFMPITLPLSILLGKDNIAFSFKLGLKDAGIIYKK